MTAGAKKPGARAMGKRVAARWRRGTGWGGGRIPRARAWGFLSGGRADAGDEAPDVIKKPGARAMGKRVAARWRRGTGWGGGRIPRARAWGFLSGGRADAGDEAPDVLKKPGARAMGARRKSAPGKWPAQAWPSSQAINPFCTCMRLAACVTTTLCGPSITSSVTSSPRRAGRQCMNIASGQCAMSAALT